MRAQRCLPGLAHVLLNGLNATGTSTEHTTCSIRRSSSGLPLGHVGRLADAAQVPNHALRLSDERELRASHVGSDLPRYDVRGPLLEGRPVLCGP